jgi:hypothetical protein
VALVAPLSRQHLRKHLVADVDPRQRIREGFLREGLAHPLGPVFVLACRLGDHLFLVVDDVDGFFEQAIGAQSDGDVVLALELGAIGAPAVDRAARGHARLAGDLVQRLAVRDALAHQVSDRGAEDVAGVRRRRVGQDLDPVGPCLAHGLCVVLTEEAMCQFRRCRYGRDVVFLAAHGRISRLSQR